MRACLVRFLPVLLAMAGSCASSLPAGPPAQPVAETVWQGEVVIAGRRVVPKGETLLIRPGTRVLFEYVDSDGDGLGESGLLVYGRITAAGTEEAPIHFRPRAEPARPGLWDGIRIERGGRSRFTSCRFTGAQWALHVHFTDLRLEESRFAENTGGVKFRDGPVEIRGNAFTGNGTAVRFWESAPRIVANMFRDNGTGIFSREGSDKSLVRGNNFIGNRDYHIKLGELQEHDVDARNNYWGTSQRSRIEELIFDRNDSSYLGRVIHEPFASDPLPLGRAAAGNTALSGQ